MTGGEDYLTVAEVTEVLRRKSPKFVLAELNAKRLRGAKIGGEWRVTPADLKAYVEPKMNVPAVRR